MIVKELSRGACRRNEARGARVSPFCASSGGGKKARSGREMSGGWMSGEFPQGSTPPLDPPAAFYKVDPAGFQPPAYLVFI
jgi:hypothetical protein